MNHGRRHVVDYRLRNSYSEQMQEMPPRSDEEGLGTGIEFAVGHTTHTSCHGDLQVSGGV